MGMQINKLLVKLLDLIIKKQVFLITVYIMIFAVPFIAGYYTNSWKFSAFYLAVFAVLWPIIYRKLQLQMKNEMIIEQRRYQNIFLQASNAMMREHNLNRLLKMLTLIVKKTVRVSFAAMFFIDENEKEYKTKYVRNKNVDIEKIVFLYDDQLINFIKLKNEPFVCEELPDDLKLKINLILKSALIIPIFYNNKLKGFLVLGEKISLEEYTRDDINLFKIIAFQAAISIENCIFMEQFSITRERIFEAEKLAAIGGLAEGVAHQINNRLNYFSLYAGEIKSAAENFIEKNESLLAENSQLKQTMNFIIQIANTLIDSVRNSGGIVHSILNYAQIEAKETYFSSFVMQEIVNLSAELLKVKHKVDKFPVEIIKDSTDIVYGIKAQLIEVVFNILDNAYEAIHEKKETLSMNFAFTPCVKLKITRDEDYCHLQFTDNGIGIKNEDQKKIFAPFYTTKKSLKSGSGSGIGMYLAKRLIEENHKGKIWFESSYGEGTNIYIKLPNCQNS